MPPKTHSMPDLTYAQRETIMSSLLARRYELERLIKETKSDDFRQGYIKNLAEVNDVYDVIQHHF